MTIEVKDIGTLDYAAAWDEQKQRVEEVKDGAAGTFYLVEHPHVYTFGKSADRNNLLVNDAFLAQIGAQRFDIERGGDITYHGPGQIVGYPIIDLNEIGIGVRVYVEKLEQVLIDTLAEYGIETERVDGLTGIWLKEGRPRKIAALGIKVSRGVTMHGFALNVNTDLNYFNHIVPCGISDKEVTTMQSELGKEIEMNEVKQKLAVHFTHHFDS